MIQIRYLCDIKNGGRFGTCSGCGKFSDEDSSMIRMTVSNDCAGREQGTSLCLCKNCRQALMITLGTNDPGLHSGQTGTDGDTVFAEPVSRSDISTVLKEAGCAGSEEEADILLTGNLKEILEEESKKIPDLIYRAVDKAVKAGDIEYSDELRKILYRNGCELETCLSCYNCAGDSVCCESGNPADLRRVDWCPHYRNGDKLCLREQDSDNELELPFIRTNEDIEPDTEEIIKAAQMYMPESVKKFLETASADKRNVVLTTWGESGLHGII